MCESGLLMSYSYDGQTLGKLAKMPARFAVALHGLKREREEVGNLTFLFPQLIEGGKFHSKLFLLKFRDCLRVVVTSANLTQCDWEEILQVIWLQDFTKGAGDFRFGAELAWFISEVTGSLGFDIETELGIDLDIYDFEPAEGDLVVSIPGFERHPEACGLGSIRQFLKGHSYTQFLYQASSIGSLAGKSLKAFRQAFTNNPQSIPSVIYPSQNCVEASRYGVDGAGQFYLRPGTLDPEVAFQEVSVLHPGYLSHSKILLIWDGEVNDDSVVYLGSHNLTISAWGPRIQNYEVGVVFGPRTDSAQWKKHVLAQLPVNMLDRTKHSSQPFYRSY